MMEEINKNIISAQKTEITSSSEEDKMRILANFLIDKIIEIHKNKKSLDNKNHKIYNDYK